MLMTVRKPSWLQPVTVRTSTSIKAMKHQEVHPSLDVEGCFGCRIAGVSFAASSMPSRRIEASQINATERRWEKDMDAYKRLRRDGLQPAHVDGAREIERKAEHRSQVETGIL